MLANHTSLTLSGQHTLDALLEHGVEVVRIFSPEHGFRGTADAGEKVASSVDSLTQLPISSLYGSGMATALDKIGDVDVVVCDLQDVGLRFYTYHITMIRMMEEAARRGKEFVVFDRPNPNITIVDGPLLSDDLHSGVGRLSIPVSHGMTMGELARMAQGEGWLATNEELRLDVVECGGYTRESVYELPVAPSPNLRSAKAIKLYGSVCLFEGTIMSLGRGTDNPFTLYGHPSMSGCEYSFTPRSMPGAKNPPLLGQKCFGRDLSHLSDEQIDSAGFDLSYVIDAYNNPGMKKLRGKFFTRFFDQLCGTPLVRQLIEQGYSANEIAQSWRADVENFRRQRLPYLLYQ